ncbi:uncharacterized protein TNIN_42851 [Trichonephila inaurata madagascariensis]|uniref:Uncharacterized protein n=1 Tax=Trichonephila inaurata madagascariensis TaxID=2747483 RepID=A0A8X6YBB6_9ARAC|nr:uncharacterized protein TNIN_42851 [Trichonephila inaurata madagascariensis]
MVRIFKEIYATRISTNLNMSKISNSQDEMSYITKMRNLKLFQQSNSEEFQYLDKKFYQEFVMHKRSLPLFRMCYSHAFFQVAKSHVLVHNYEPFRHWDMIVIDNDGHPKTENGYVLMTKPSKNIEAIPKDRFLVADNVLATPSVPYWNFYPYYKGVITDMQSNIFEQFYAESFFLRHETTWRRVYDANRTFFFC